MLLNAILPALIPGWDNLENLWGVAMAVTVKIYSLSTWPHCQTAKEYLSQKEVDYEVFDVRENPRALKEMVDISGKRQVPVVVIGEDHRVGFNPQEIDKMLAAAGL